MPQPYSGSADLARMAGLAAAHPAGQRHVADLPYRLASWALETLDNARLWVDERSRLAGFAILQGPWSTLDLGLTPEARAAGLLAEMLTWGAERGQVIADRRRRPFTLYLETGEAEAALRTPAEAQGFQGCAYEVLHLERALNGPVAEATLPAGFLIRPLRGEAECAASVEAHRAAFGTTSMTLDWRQRVLLAPGYAPDLDLVVEAPDGRLAAFCVSWPARGGAWAQLEPGGVHPDFRRRGLGRALLTEMLRRLARRGAQTVVVEMQAGDGPAVTLCEAAGFKTTRRYAALERTFAPARERRR